MVLLVCILSHSYGLETRVDHDSDSFSMAPANAFKEVKGEVPVFFFFADHCLTFPSLLPPTWKDERPAFQVARDLGVDSLKDGDSFGDTVRSIRQSEIGLRILQAFSLKMAKDPNVKSKVLDAMLDTLVFNLNKTKVTPCLCQYAIIYSCVYRMMRLDRGHQ